MTMRELIKVEECITNRNCYRQVSNQFMIAKSTITGIVVGVCLVMESKLLSRTVSLGPLGRVRIPFTYSLPLWGQT